MRTAVTLPARRHQPPEPEEPNDDALWRPEDSVGYRLKLALHAWTRQLDTALRPLGVTHVQFIVLVTIEIFREREETPSQVRIAETMKFDVMMVSKILRRLESRGYIERNPHPDDPRANALHLTPAGRELVRAGSQVVRAAHVGFFDCRLDSNGKRSLAALLDRLLLPGTATN